MGSPIKIEVKVIHERNEQVFSARVTKTVTEDALFKRTHQHNQAGVLAGSAAKAALLELQEILEVEG